MNIGLNDKTLRQKRIMTITAERKQELIKEYRREESDTGSPEVQVSVLTERIVGLTEHLKAHKHDFASRRGLLMLVSKRTSLLQYLAKTDDARYKELIGRLGLRR